MSRILRVVQGDTGPQWTAVLTDKETGYTLDLTDVTSGSMKIRAVGTTTVLDTVPLVIGLPTTAGIIKWTWNAGTLATLLGSYEGEISFVLTGGLVWTLYDVLPIQVREDF